MTATLIDGTTVAEQVRNQVAADVAALNMPPGLATVLIGDANWFIAASDALLRRAVG